MQCSPESRGSCAVLAYRGHLLTENRNGLVRFDTHLSLAIIKKRTRNTAPTIEIRAN
jgi:hypothetical protein